MYLWRIPAQVHAYLEEGTVKTTFTVEINFTFPSTNTQGWLGVTKFTYEPPPHTHINKCLRAGVIAQSVKCLLHPGGAGRSKEILSSQFWGDRNRQSSVDFWPISLVHLMSSRSTRDTVSYSKVNGTRGMILNAGNWLPLAYALAHMQVCTHKSKQAYTQTHTLTRTKCSEAYLGYSHCHSVFIKICEGIFIKINKMEGDSKVALFFTVK